MSPVEAPHTPWNQRQEMILAAAVGIALGLFALAPFIPIQDYWNHVASAYVASRLLGGDPMLAQSYWLVWKPVPNLSTELLLMGLVRVLPPDAAGRALLSILVLTTSSAFVWLRASIRAKGGELHLAWAVPFALSSFFAFGFFNFQLGLATSVMWIAATEGKPKGPARWVISPLLALLTYFSHAVPFAIGAAFVIGRAAVGGSRRERIIAAVSTVPGATLLLWFARMPETSPVEWSDRAVPPFQWWNLPGIKLSGVLTTTSSFSYAVAFAKLMLVMACWRALRREPTRDSWMRKASIACCVLYLVVPFQVGHVTFGLDWRCLPFAWLFFLLSRDLGTRARALTGRAALAIAVLTVAEFGLYTLHWSARAPELEALIDAVPPGSRVLPVVSIQALARVNPLVHLPAQTLTRGASYYPYLFAYRYHLIRQRTYPGRLPHPELVSPWNQQTLAAGGCDDLYSPTGGLGLLAAPLVAVDKAFECLPWKLRGLAGGEAGQFPNLAEIRSSFDGLLILGGSGEFRARLAELGQLRIQNDAGAYVSFASPNPRSEGAAVP